MSLRNLQQYQDLLKPKGAELFAQHATQSILNSKINMESISKAEEAGASVKQSLSIARDEKGNRTLEYEERENKNASQKLLRSQVGSTINQEMMVVEMPVYPDSHLNESITHQQVLTEDQVQDFLFRKNKRALPHNPSSKLTSNSQTPPDWESVYHEQRKKLSSMSKGDQIKHSNYESKHISLPHNDSGLPTSNYVSGSGQVTGQSQASKKQIVYQKDSKNTSINASRMLIQNVSSSEQVRLSQAIQYNQRSSVDDQELKDAGTSPLDRDDDEEDYETFFNDPRIQSQYPNAQLQKQVIYQNILDSQKQLFVRNSLQKNSSENDYNAKLELYKMSPPKTSKSAVGQRFYQQAPFTSQTPVNKKRFIIKDISGGKKVLYGTNHQGVLHMQVCETEQCSSMNVSGHHIMTTSQRMKQEMLKMYKLQQQMLHRQQIIDFKDLNSKTAFSSLNQNHNYLMSIIEDNPSNPNIAFNQNVATHNLQSRISNATSSELDPSKLMNYSNAFQYGKQIYNFNNIDPLLSQGQLNPKPFNSANITHANPFYQQYPKQNNQLASDDYNSQIKHDLKLLSPSFAQNQDYQEAKQLQLTAIDSQTYSNPSSLPNPMSTLHANDVRLDFVGKLNHKLNSEDFSNLKQEQLQQIKGDELKQSSVAPINYQSQTQMPNQLEAGEKPDILVNSQKLEVQSNFNKDLQNILLQSKDKNFASVELQQKHLVSQDLMERQSQLKSRRSINENSNISTHLYQQRKSTLRSQQTQRQNHQSSKRHSFEMNISNFSKGELPQEPSFYQRIVNPIAGIKIQNKSPKLLEQPIKQQTVKDSQVIQSQFRIRKSQQNWLQKDREQLKCKTPNNQSAKLGDPQSQSLGFSLFNKSQERARTGGLFNEISRQFSEAANQKFQLVCQNLQGSGAQNQLSKSQNDFISSKRKEEARLQRMRDIMKMSLAQQKLEEEQEPSQVLRNSDYKLGTKPQTPSEQAYTKYLSAIADKRSVVLNHLNKSQMQCKGYPFVMNATSSIFNSLNSKHPAKIRI